MPQIPSSGQAGLQYQLSRAVSWLTKSRPYLLARTWYILQQLVLRAVILEVLLVVSRVCGSNCAFSNEGNCQAAYLATQILNEY